MKDAWMIWRLVTPREGLFAVGGVMVASFLIHLVVMLGTDRYIDKLLG